MKHNTRQFDTVIFDLDGTLLNTLEDLMDAVNYALTQFRMPARTLEEIRRFVGNGVRVLMERAVPEGAAHPQFEQIFACFRQYYQMHCNDKTRPYDGVLELLETLREDGYAMAIVSNKPDAAVKTLNELYFHSIVTVAIGQKDAVPTKPAPDMVEEALRQLHASKDTAVYIGDSEVDMETARNAKLPCISVLWGFRDRAFLEDLGAQQFADEPQDIIGML